MKKRTALILCVVLTLTASAVMTGCGSKNQGGAAGSKDTLIYGSQDYTAINPALYEHGEINMLLFAGLTAHDAENRVVPACREMVL